MIKMSSFKFFMIFVFLLSLSSSLFTFTSAAIPTYLYHACSDENFTRNSTYQSNLNDLLSSLPSNATSNDGFSNATKGQVPNRVYGIFQCRGDVATSTCQDCMNFASDEASQRCPAQKGAVLWYDECLLHYNASDFFSTEVQNPGIMMYNTNNVTVEPYRFRELTLNLMTEAVAQAANDPKRFATRKGDSTTSQTLYTLVQCTQDLSNTSCFRCLQRAISALPEVSIGGRVLYPNCHCRFEIYPFYVENEIRTTSQAPAPSAYPIYFKHICSEENFTIYSNYESNRNFLFSSLSSNANSSGGFSNATKGQDPNRVYGLFQCRGDVDTSTCRDCVAFASEEATQLCPTQKGAVLWYDVCLLHYNASNFFSTAVLAPRVKRYKQDVVQPLLYQSSLRMHNINNVEPDPFYQLMLSLMNEAATQAANDPKKFGTKKGNSTTSQTPYTLVQCTQDLSSTVCARCLKEAIGSILPNESIGGSMLLPSCYCRFENYLFYTENQPPAPTPSPPTPAKRPGKSRISSSLIVGIVVLAAVSVLLFVTASYCLLTRRARKENNAVPEEIAGNILTIEALHFDFGTIQAATNRFSIDNKLGEGGFGEVYKGILPNGQEIAVKRLSKKSKQGVKEFKNEVIVVAKLQHKNLVRLQGFCLEGEEKILVYEFVPNKSLDYFLYDTIKQGQLDWSTRYQIIEGIARGILYLHEDSRPRIIHRDLKASNILLDESMNPKISDFGMAKIFEVDQIEGNTSKIVGTYGYMSPEYAMHGQFSVKSDVYSFGVLVLEVITGRKNNSFYQSDRVRNLLSYAWECWRDETPMQLLDSTLIDSYSKNEVMRCIHVGLLCVQEDPAVRPTMATVIHMLNNYSISLPLPQQPAFFLGTRTELNMHTPIGDSQSTSKSMPCSVDDASITELNPR